MEPAPASSTSWKGMAAPERGEPSAAMHDSIPHPAVALPDPAGSPPPDFVKPVPLDLLDLPAAGERWAVLHTLSRCEKKVARACERLGVRHYLPLRERRTGTRCRHVHLVPLFPGYVFACLGASRLGPLLESGAIARVIAVRFPASLLDELRQIRAALAAGADLIPGPALERGMRVRVASGLLGGILGRVAWVRRHRVRLVLNVTMLGRGAEVEVDAEAVAPMETLASGAPAGGAAQGACAHHGGRRPWRVRRGRVVGDSQAGVV